MSTKVVTGKVRLSYCYLFEPQAALGGGEPKYAVTMLIPKSDAATVAKVQAAIREAREAYCAKNGATALPASPKHPMRDGDGLTDSGDPFGPECHGCWVIKARSKTKPVVVDAFGNVITDPAEVYGGCYGRVSFTLFGYNAAGSKGIGSALLAVQKLHDGEPFGTVGSADDFNDGFSDGGAGDDFLS
jgi:hypothetical protein